MPGLVPIHQIPNFGGVARDAIASDEVELQTAGGGVSVRSTAGAIAALGGAQGPQGIPGPAGPQMFPNLKMAPFNAVGDGSTDDTVAVRAFFDLIGNKTGYVPAGIYLTDFFQIQSGTHVFGDGPDTSKFLAKSTLALGSPLMQNAHPFPAIKNTYTDKNIVVENIGFDGNGLGTTPNLRTEAFVEFVATQDCMFLNCRIANIKYIGLGVFNGFNCRVIGCNFFNTGNPDATSNAGAALWIANTEGWNNIGNKVIGCNFDTINSSAILVDAINTLIDSCLFTNVRATCIYAPWPNFMMTVNNCQFNIITTENVSIDPGSGIDFGGEKISITNNQINQCDGPNINMQSAQQVVISGNFLCSPGQNSAPGTYGCISFLSMDVSQQVFQPKNITITGNVLCNEGAVASNGIMLGGQNLGPAVVGPVVATLAGGLLQIANSGTGYAVGDTGLITGGAGNAIYEVVAIYDGGGVQQVILPSGGSGYSNAFSVPTTPSGTQPGSGSGLQLNITTGSFNACYPYEDMVITGNSVSGSAWDLGPIVIGTALIFGGDPVTPVSVLGANCIINNNSGIPDDGTYDGQIEIPNTSSGTITVTGIPFRPSTLQFSAVIPSGGGSGGSLSQSDGTVDVDLTNLSNSLAADSGGFFASTDSAIKLYTGNATVKVNASVTSYTDDGFVITIAGTTTADAYLRFTARR